MVVITRKAALEEVGMKITAWVYHATRDVSDACCLHTSAKYIPAAKLTIDRS